MFFFGKNKAVFSLFEASEVAEVVVGVNFMIFVWVVRNCIYVCVFFFVSDINYVLKNKLQKS